MQPNTDDKKMNHPRVPSSSRLAVAWRCDSLKISAPQAAMPTA